MNAGSSNRTSPALPMKFVATPRPDRNDRKSIVGPWMLALRPPAHSTWATLRPPRSADWAIDSTCRTFGAANDVELPNGWPLTWNVLLVDPWTPGQAPVARVYQPAPVFGGAWVSRPPPVAEAPFLRKSAIVGMTPWPAYFWTRSWRRPSEAKKTALSVGALAFPAACVAPDAEPLSGAPVAGTASRPSRRAPTISRTVGRTRTCATLSPSLAELRACGHQEGAGCAATAGMKVRRPVPIDRTPSLCGGNHNAAPVSVPLLAREHWMTWACSSPDHGIHGCARGGHVTPARRISAQTVSRLRYGLGSTGRCDGREPGTAGAGGTQGEP